MSVSQYDPVWDMLKLEKFVRLQVPRTDNQTVADTKEMFKRIRKAISHRKLVDEIFMAANPNARLEVVSRNYETGIIELQLLFITPPFNMLTLKD